MSWKTFIFTMSIAIFLVACGSSEEVDNTQAEVVVPAPVERPSSPPGRSPASRNDLEDYVLVDVYYGTDRNPVEGFLYGADRGVSFEYGIAEVSIPRDHKIGELESPVWWKFEFEEDSSRHIVLHDVITLSYEDFFDQMKGKLSTSLGSDVFVFVHGFNVTFEESVKRTAQLAHDLGYPGIPVTYSWPSQGAASLSAYTTDSNYSDWAFPHLKDFLVDIKNQTQADRIHVLAHSMGNKVLTKAIKSLDTGELLLNQVILAAPDIDAEIFKDQIAPYLTGKAERYSMYVSAKDAALILSNRLQKGNRVGSARDDIVIVDGVDTIDASTIDTSVLGHSYYGDERELIMDIYNIIKNDIPPNRRNYTERNRSGMTYWELRD